MDIKEILYNQLSPTSWLTREEVGVPNTWELLMDTLSESQMQDYVDIVKEPEKYIDPSLCPESFLPWIASIFNFDLLYWRDKFKWSVEKQREIVAAIGVKQRLMSTREGIIWFVENFIEGAKIISIYEPYNDVAKVGQMIVSGPQHIQDNKYWRHHVIKVDVSNGGYYVETLLRWMVDPRVKIVINHILSSDLILEMDCEINAFTELESHDYFNTSSAIIVSGKPSISMNQYISGQLTVCWPNTSIIVYGLMENWKPLANSIWQIDELGTRTEIISDKIKVSDSGEISSLSTIGGSRKVIYNTPLISDSWDYFGDIENKED